jgi:hypothetical protein
MPARIQRRAGTIAFAVLLVVGFVPRVNAQVPRFSVDASLAFLSSYPERLVEGCGHAAGVSPSIRLQYRANRLLSAEVGVSGQVQVPPDAGPCDILIPLPLPGQTYVVRTFDAAPSNTSGTLEARAVLTPVANAAGTLRLLGGMAWYPGRSAEAWMVGAGLRPRTTWGAVVLDVERWQVGSSYRRVRVRYGSSVSNPTVETLGSGREWGGHWQYRLGFAIWTR